VGEDGEAFSVHKKLLCSQSEYFRACFQRNFAESNSGSIELRQNLAHAVATFLSWLYTDRISLTQNDMRTPDLVNLYAFADMIICGDYHNDLMDSIRAQIKSDRSYIGIKVIMRLYDRGLRDSQLAKYGMQTIYFNMVSDPMPWKEGKDENGVKSWSTNAEIMFDFQKEMWRAWIEAPEVSPSALIGCVFHQHKDGEK
jgi:BTB/POZ domain